MGKAFESIKAGLAGALADAARRTSRPHAEAVIELLRSDPDFADEYLCAAMDQADQEGGREALAQAVSRCYPVQLQWSAEDAGWLATFPALPGCSAWGATEIEALTEGRAAALAWLEAHRAAGNSLPVAKV